MSTMIRSFLDKDHSELDENSQTSSNPIFDRILECPEGGVKQ